MDVRGEALEFAADGGFRDAQESGDFEQRVLVEEVGGEQEAVLRRELMENLFERVAEASELRGFVGRLRCDGWFEAGAGFGEWGFAPCAAVVVDVALRKRGAEPAHQRAAAGVAGERGAALTGALGETEELGVERVCEVFAE